MVAPFSLYPRKRTFGSEPTPTFGRPFMSPRSSRHAAILDNIPIMTIILTARSQSWGAVMARSGTRSGRAPAMAPGQSGLRGLRKLVCGGAPGGAAPYVIGRAGGPDRKGGPRAA